MPYVRVNDIQMYYELQGEGEPLALIVGLGTDISEWDVIIRWLQINIRSWPLITGALAAQTNPTYPIRLK